MTNTGIFNFKPAMLSRIVHMARRVLPAAHEEWSFRRRRRDDDIAAHELRPVPFDAATT